jgi:hypothetical protein
MTTQVNVSSKHQIALPASVRRSDEHSLSRPGDLGTSYNGQLSRKMLSYALQR